MTTEIALSSEGDGIGMREPSGQARVIYANYLPNSLRSASNASSHVHVQETRCASDCAQKRITRVCANPATRIDFDAYVVNAGEAT